MRNLTSCILRVFVEVDFKSFFYLEFNAKVKILMNLVDYPEWRNNFDIWKFLATLLEGSAGEKTLLNCQIIDISITIIMYLL